MIDSAVPRSVAIVGSGPAGLMAAEVLSRKGCSVLVYDRLASPARKLLMAGRGGLNLTHSEPLDTFLSRYGEAGPWLSRLLAGFSPEDTVAWANGLGVETFTGSSGRVFPKAMKASPLLRAWLRRLQAQGVSFRLGHYWTGWEEPGALRFDTGNGVGARAVPDATLLALGGASWPRLGTDGGWVGTLEAAGVPITPLEASNAGALVAWSDHMLERCDGKVLKRIGVSVGGETQRGEAVITRSGLEGGAVYALSAAIRRACREGRRAPLLIDLKPDFATEEIAQRLDRPRGKISTANFLRRTLALSGEATVLLNEGRQGPLPSDPLALAQRIKAVPLEVHGLAGLPRAISTAGGIRLDALTEDMMLKARPGVFAAGEMLDWDAPTGGYLLQGCLATGVAAAQGIEAWLARKRV